jgi:hypothetical protein
MQLPKRTSVQTGPPTPTLPGRARPDSSQVEPVRDEQIAEIIGRIQQRYPHEQISQAELEGRVRGFHRQFSTARIRTFVAIFVERLVRRSIEETSVGAPRAVAAEPRMRSSWRLRARRLVRR